MDKILHSCSPFSNYCSIWTIYPLWQKQQEDDQRPVVCEYGYSQICHTVLSVQKPKWSDKIYSVSIKEQCRPTLKLLIAAASMTNPRVVVNRISNTKFLKEAIDSYLSSPSSKMFT
ncbi:hypothetical protein F2Q68_00030506 [Brassica cretica]|uniref:START domain-containing protein n=2 Tax=Brassica cretica TaxID=69181 RepID=A0ABQ7BK82_BRACR|nr:hypothetical protein F2Q68_00030506 [Brassica cretica]KAF3532948.1 hypothetical protein DY000_02038945 [Brassica cretica]